MWQTMRRASLDFSAALRRLEIRCDLAPCDLLTIARASSEPSRSLLREYQSRRDAGLDHSWLKPAAVTREAAVESGGAIRTRGLFVRSLSGVCWLGRGGQRARGNPLRTIARSRDSRRAKGRAGLNRERHGASRRGLDCDVRSR